MEIDIWNVEEKRIAPQQFDLAIALAVIEISGTAYCAFAAARNVVYIMLGIWTARLLLLLFFRKYLRNFKTGRAIYWMNWNIVAHAVLTIFYASLSYDTGSLYYNNEIDPITIFRDLSIVSIIISIIYGIHLQRIRNDFIGLLSTTGLCLSIIIPVVELINGLSPYIIMFVSNTVGASTNYYYFLRIARTISYSAPTVIMILIFMRAKRYVLHSNNPDSSNTDIS